MLVLMNPRALVRWFFTVVNGPPPVETWIDTWVTGPPARMRCGRTSP